MQKILLPINTANEALSWTHHILYSDRRFNLRRRRRRRPRRRRRRPCHCESKIKRGSDMGGEETFYRDRRNRKCFLRRICLKVQQFEYLLGRHFLHQSASKLEY